MKRLFLALSILTFAAACVRNPETLPPPEVAKLAYRHPAPPSLTLYTVVNRSTQSGAHTALAVNGSERVLFDPAGGFEGQGITRSGDVIYGFTPAVEQAYSSAHARKTFLVTKQTIRVSPQVAEMALQKVKTNGAVGSAHCAQSTSSILKTLPGLSNIEQTYYPKALSAQFAKMAGVKLATLIEDD